MIPQLMAMETLQGFRVNETTVAYDFSTTEPVLLEPSIIITPRVVKQLMYVEKSCISYKWMEIVERVRNSGELDTPLHPALLVPPVFGEEILSTAQFLIPHCNLRISGVDWR